MDISEWR
jgi:subfamily B ATP-binding cassette protein MsbA